MRLPTTLTWTRAAVAAILSAQGCAPTLDTAEGEGRTAAPVGVRVDADDPLADRAARADGVFLGTVTDISYRTSDAPDDGAVALPHTYVTFRVERGWKGAPGDGELTLRFLGGPADDGRVLHVSGQPLFAPGGRELLFVAGNGESGCPLVDCAQGRYRVLDGQVFTDSGRRLEVADDGSVRLGRRDLRPELHTARVGDAVFGRIHSEPDHPEMDTGGEALGVAALLGRVDSATAALADTGVGEGLASASIHDPLVIAKPGKVAVPALAPPPPVPPAATDEDAREIEAMRAQGGNPVLPPR